LITSQPEPQIANQTLSQSIPPLVVTTIGGLSKVFIGEIVEKAREVQAQWLAAAAPDGVFKEEMRGPLLPDHLREAVRRYRKDGEGGGAGFRGLSLGASEGSYAAGRGKRLFR
jgi:transcription initiation factor TFIID subunit 11